MFSISKKRIPNFPAALQMLSGGIKILTSTRHSSILPEQIQASRLRATEKVKSGGKKEIHWLSTGLSHAGRLLHRVSLTLISFHREQRAGIFPLPSPRWTSPQSCINQVSQT